MPDVKVEIETRERPGGGRQISARRFGTEALADREHDLQAAVNAVVASMVKVVENGPASLLRVGALEVTFNVAFAPEEGAYLCASASDGTFAVKLSLTLSAPPATTGSAPPSSVIAG